MKPWLAAVLCLALAPRFVEAGGKALSYARGMFVSYDHTYHFLGVRGLSSPGD